MKKILLIIITLFISCEKREILKNDIISSEKIMGIEFSSSERDSLLNTVSRRLDQIELFVKLISPIIFLFHCFMILFLLE